ncbi:MAG: bifunctional diaminohydroxyphosphoribosylaminopyrimidine deaminase/5-amino-6-(5-phosphoribosylamino)uracil reductase RibD [Paludibacteraceae bacterium]|nr:bifunctional diaminohydroxyphosphoribosylaminopyrimidine deaminase/5-amino-6-(5-phosphoribosylamino)uracil reductase RibD [Paludibacteraceae bacterium]
MTEEEKYIARCLQIASYGDGYVAPNPLVGAIVVSNNKIIGEGFHQYFGKAHAERNAILSVKDPEQLKNATLYVNLEPCAHYGHTPPCANFIVDCKIPKVVIGTYDPNPDVYGQGVEILQKAGIEVKIGVLEKECKELNKRFFTFHEKKRPFVTLKWAQTIDGFMDKNRTNVQQAPLLISNNFTRVLAHKMRSENQAILVGTNTVLLDNPSLTVRYWSGKTPVRIVLDRLGKIPENYHLLNNSTPTIIFTEKPYQEKLNVKYIPIDFDKNILSTVLQKIYELNIHSILVEGGAQLLTNFIISNLWDETYVEVAPFEISEGVTAPIIPLMPFARKNFYGHEWYHYKNKK